MIIVCKYLPARGMALWPLILVKNAGLKDDARLINHERIHHRQQLELLLIGFYIGYIINYLWLIIIRRRPHKLALREIIFEKEAYANDSNLNYLTTRKFYNYVQITKFESRRYYRH